MNIRLIFDDGIDVTLIEVYMFVINEHEDYVDIIRKDKETNSFEFKSIKSIDIAIVK